MSVDAMTRCARCGYSLPASSVDGCGFCEGCRRETASRGPCAGTVTGYDTQPDWGQWGAPRYAIQCLALADGREIHLSTPGMVRDAAGEPVAMGTAVVYYGFDRGAARAPART